MRNHLITLATLLALLAGASPVLASGRDVIEDCTADEAMSRTYTQKEYRDALATLPADADEYGNCRDIIARAQESAATKGGAKNNSADTTATPGAAGPGAQGPTGTPGSAPVSEQLAAAAAADRAAAEEAARDGASAAAGPGNPIAEAGIGRAPGAGQVSDLPAPVIVLLALVCCGALALAVVRIRSLVNARRA